ncbi:MAG: helix-turn-helix domain-containing protein [Polyangiaceae bacterium]
MAQQLKDEVRNKMLDAGGRVFASAGYGGATMAAIAREAGVSTGNLYRYFGGKDELFYTLFTDEFAAEHLRRVRRRVGSLVATPDLEALGEEARRDGEALLRFWIENRARVVVLLARAEGTRFADHPARFVEALMRPTLAGLSARTGKRRLGSMVRFTLRNVFDNTVRTIVAILEEHEEEAAITEAFQAFWSYQLAGLAGLERWASRVSESRRVST